MAIIENGLDAALMRNKMESKDTLANKGALYVGTGNYTQVKNTDDTESTLQERRVPETTSISPVQNAGGGISSDESGKVLIVDPNSTTGWKIDKINTLGIANGAVTPEKLDTEYYVKNQSIGFSSRVSETLPYITWSKATNVTGRPSTLTLNIADFSATERTNTTLNLPVVNAVNTLATKEQIENGDIVAKTALAASTSSYASTANATSIGDKSLTDIFSSDGTTVKRAVVAQETDFTNANWIIHTSGSSEVEVRDSALYEIVLSKNGLFLVVGGGVGLSNKSRAFDIITEKSSEQSTSAVLKYFDVYEALISSNEYTSYLTVSQTRYEATILGGYMYWQLGTRTTITDFRYRRIA